MGFSKQLSILMKTLQKWVRFGGGEQPVGGYWLLKRMKVIFLIFRIQKKYEEIAKET
jgi:hypothetical protein